MRATVAILLWEKSYVKTKTATRHKEHYIMIKRSIHQEDQTIIKTCNIKTPKYIKQTLPKIKTERESHKNLQYTLNNAYNMQKVNEDIVDLNTITDQMDLTDILRTLYPMAGTYIHSFQLVIEHSSV